MMSPCKLYHACLWCLLSTVVAGMQHTSVGVSQKYVLVCTADWVGLEGACVCYHWRSGLPKLCSREAEDQGGRHFTAGVLQRPAFCEHITIVLLVYHPNLCVDAGR